MLELQALMDKKVGDLSGGQMQRAMLAYAITKEPRLLIMDEPTSWVDVKGADCFLCIMEEFKKKGIAMVIVSHDFSVVRTTATHVLGLGPEGWFFRPASDPETERQVVALFGTLHHGGEACVILRDTSAKPKGNLKSPPLRGGD
jgi:zinc transport system ATP-binding protein